MLSDLVRRIVTGSAYMGGLNAPFGARCFLTFKREVKARKKVVLMHLLALGAF